MILAGPFLVVFIAGLGAAVYSMLQGVTASPAAGITTRIGMITAPSVAAFAIAFGAVGYLCTTRTSLSYPVIAFVAVLGGAATIPISAPLLARLAKARKSAPSDDHEIEGQPARVSRAITDSSIGEISYERDGRHFTHPALNLIEGSLSPGRDVVIDRIENGVAYVEDWERVERRL